MRELKLHTAEFERAVGRLLASSRRDGSVVMQQQMRSVLRRVVEITPPGTAGIKGGTRAAQKLGQAVTGRDISRVYGTASEAYDQIEMRSKAKASAFWIMAQGGNEEQAHRILWETVGRSFSPFDDGKAHRSMLDANGRVQGKKKIAVFYVRTSEQKRLEAYIKEKQSHVYRLAAGWKEALTKLGGSVPQMIAVHDSPGALDLVSEMGRWILRAHNDVTFASNVKDLERRIQWALDSQASALIRQWDKFVRDQAIKNNFKTS